MKYHAAARSDEIMQFAATRVEWEHVLVENKIVMTLQNVSLMYGI